MNLKIILLISFFLVFTVINDSFSLKHDLDYYFNTDYIKFKFIYKLKILLTNQLYNLL